MVSHLERRDATLPLRWGEGNGLAIVREGDGAGDGERAGDGDGEEV